MANLVSTLPDQQVTNYDWAQTVLQSAGLPVTTNNVLNITRWMVSEEPASDWYHANNPLNINAGGSGYDTFPSLTASAQRTAQYLAMSNYTQIRAALASDAPWPTFEAAVVASPWAAGHYGGALFSGTPAVVSVTGQTLTAGSAGSAGGSGSSTTLDSVNGGSSGDPRTCGAKGGGVDILFGHIGTACQLKALTAGLLIGLGGAVMMIGVVVLVGRTKSVREAVGAVAGGVAGGPAGVAKGASLGAATAPVKAPKVPAPAPVAPAVAPAAPAPVAGPSEDYGQGWLDGVESMLGGGKPQPRNKRQATRQAESLFDQLGISSPGPSARQTNSLGADLPF